MSKWDNTSGMSDRSRVSITNRALWSEGRRGRGGERRGEEEGRGRGRGGEGRGRGGEGRGRRGEGRGNEVKWKRPSLLPLTHQHNL